MSHLNNSRKLSRRWMVAGVGAVWLSSASPAWAGSYLNRAALLVGEAGREAALLRKHLYDKEFAMLVHRVSIGRLKAAREMLVPKEVIEAHPHLLLMLEKFERAAQAAVDRHPQLFLKRLRQARDERQVFGSILKQLGWELPPL